MLSSAVTCSVIDYGEYASMIARHPAMLKPLTLSVSELVAAATGAGGGTSKD